MRSRKAPRAGGRCIRAVAAALVLPSVDAVEHAASLLPRSGRRHRLKSPFGTGSHTHGPRSAHSGRGLVRESARDEWLWRMKCRPVPIGAWHRPGHGGPMTVLAAYDPQTLDRAPVRFAAAAARSADVPLVIASIRAGVAPAPSARVDLLGEELERLSADLTHEYGIEVRTRVVKALPPMGVTRGLRNVIDEERREPRRRRLEQARRGRPGRSRDHGPAGDQRLRLPRCRRPSRPRGAEPADDGRRRLRAYARGPPRAARGGHHRPDGPARICAC